MNASEEKILEQAQKRLETLRRSHSARRHGAEKKNCAFLASEYGINREVGAGQILFLDREIKHFVREIKRVAPSEPDVFLQVWRKITTENIAAATTGITCKNGYLHIGISNFVIKNELENFYSGDLLRLFKEQMPKKILRGIKFSISHPVPPQPGN